MWYIFNSTLYISSLNTFRYEGAFYLDFRRFIFLTPISPLTQYLLHYSYTVTTTLLLHSTYYTTLTQYLLHYSYTVPTTLLLHSTFLHSTYYTTLTQYLLHYSYILFCFSNLALFQVPSSKFYFCLLVIRMVSMVTSNIVHNLYKDYYFSV